MTKLRIVTFCLIAFLTCLSVTEAAFPRYIRKRGRLIPVPLARGPIEGWKATNASQGHQNIADQMYREWNRKYYRTRR